jgi:integrase
MSRTQAGPERRPARQYGTGSVYQRASDGRWLGTIEHGFTRSGARRRVTVTGKSEAEVKAKIKAKQREIARGEDTAGRTTVKAWAATWLTMTSTSVRPKTHVTDKGAVRYIVAAIGHRRLDQLTPADVRAVRTAVTDDGLSTSTALRYHGTLMRMLKKARDEGHDVAARVLAVRPPTKAVSDRRAIPLPDSLALLSIAAELGHGSRWVAALLQGMRQGECLGLTWEQVDLDAGSLTISWQLQALNYRDKSNRRAKASSSPTATRCGSSRAGCIWSARSPTPAGA